MAARGTQDERSWQSDIVIAHSVNDSLYFSNWQLSWKSAKTSVTPTSSHRSGKEVSQWFRQTWDEKFSALKTKKFLKWKICLWQFPMKSPVEFVAACLGFISVLSQSVRWWFFEYDWNAFINLNQMGAEFTIGSQYIQRIMKNNKCSSTCTVFFYQQFQSEVLKVI